MCSDNCALLDVELYRVWLPKYDQAIKKLKFNFVIEHPIWVSIKRTLTGKGAFKYYVIGLGGEWGVQLQLLTLMTLLGGIPYISSSKPKILTIYSR